MTAQQATEAIGLIVAMGLALAPLVFMAVAMLRGMIVSKRRRRVILPIAGTLIGWIMAGLVLAVVGVEPSTHAVAIMLLAGFFGFGSASGLNAQQRQSARSEADDRG